MLVCKKCLILNKVPKLINLENTKIGYCASCKNYGFQVNLGTENAQKFLHAKVVEKVRKAKSREEYANRKQKKA